MHRNAPIPCEVLTLWETEADLLAGAEKLAEPGPAGEDSGDALSAQGGTHAEYGTLALRE